MKVSWKFGVAKMHHKKLQKKNYDYEYQQLIEERRQVLVEESSN
ncbi:hypothetical protein [Limosilactobacillus fermentum]|nr:hypothetical protein [Limosilactobacillus fermentum]